MVFFVKHLRILLSQRIKTKIKRTNVLKLKDFTSIVKYFQKMKEIRVYYGNTSQSDLMLKKGGIKNWQIEWHEGHLFNEKERKELLYFHFILSKLKKTFYIEKIKSGNDSFIIKKSGISNLFR
jgi:hypothetical protein